MENSEGDGPLARVTPSLVIAFIQEVAECINEEPDVGSLCLSLCSGCASSLAGSSKPHPPRDPVSLSAQLG